MLFVMRHLVRIDTTKQMRTSNSFRPFNFFCRPLLLISATYLYSLHCHYISYSSPFLDAAKEDYPISLHCHYISLVYYGGGGTVQHAQKQKKQTQTLAGSLRSTGAST